MESEKNISDYLTPLSDSIVCLFDACLEASNQWVGWCTVGDVTVDTVETVEGLRRSRKQAVVPTMLAHTN